MVARILNFSSTRWHQHRSRRVTALLASVLLLSGLDLALTFQQMSTIGLLEENPLARLLAHVTGSALALVALKVASLAVAIGVLFMLRRSWQSEIGAWFAVAVLCWLTLRWIMYLQVLAGLDPDTLAMMAQDHACIVAN